MKLALVGRKGAYPGRWTVKEAKAMYAHGVQLGSNDVIQVWQTLDNGDLLHYDGDRTRRMSDKIVAARPTFTEVKTAAGTLVRVGNQFETQHTLMRKDGVKFVSTKLVEITKIVGNTVEYKTVAVLKEVGRPDWDKQDYSKTTGGILIDYVENYLKPVGANWEI